MSSALTFHFAIRYIGVELIAKYGGAAVCMFLVGYILSTATSWMNIKRTQDLEAPPKFHIPAAILPTRAITQTYNNAFTTHPDASVILIPRHGRNEYVVDHVHAPAVLTDAKNFDFDKAVTHMLHMEFILWFKGGSFVREMDGVVERGVQSRLGSVVEMVGSVLGGAWDDIDLRRDAAEQSCITDDEDTIEIADVFPRIQHAIAHAMVLLLLGPSSVSHTTTAHFVALTNAIASLSGVFENTHSHPLFPRVYALLITLRAISFTIIPVLILHILPPLYRTRHTRLLSAQHTPEKSFIPLFDAFLLKHYKPHTLLGPANILFSAAVTLGVIFASIHQTAVVACWTLFTLAQRPEYIPAIRKEWAATIPRDAAGRQLFTVGALGKCVLLDSFIREVLRTKPDTFAPVRHSTAAVRIGNHVVPPDSLVVPLVHRMHTHEDNVGADGGLFRGFQWADKSRPAVQGNADFVAFGLGRWACPGRHLAVAEVKMLVGGLVGMWDVGLKGDVRVEDWGNTTARAPGGVVVVRRV